MGDTLTRDKYLRFLSLAPTGVLEQVGNCLIVEAQTLPEDSADLEILEVMLGMLGMEYQLRQIEPLWRKAKRFAARNSDTFKQVGKIAACIGVGAILGVSLDN